MLKKLIVVRALTRWTISRVVRAGYRKKLKNYQPAMSIKYLSVNPIPWVMHLKISTCHLPWNNPRPSITRPADRKLCKWRIRHCLVWCHDQLMLSVYPQQWQDNPPLKWIYFPPRIILALRHDKKYLESPK